MVLFKSCLLTVRKLKVHGFFLNLRASNKLGIHIFLSQTILQANPQEAHAAAFAG